MDKFFEEQLRKWLPDFVNRKIENGTGPTKATIAMPIEQNAKRPRINDEVSISQILDDDDDDVVMTWKKELLDDMEEMAESWE